MTKNIFIEILMVVVVMNISILTVVRNDMMIII